MVVNIQINIKSQEFLNALKQMQNKLPEASKRIAVEIGQSAVKKGQAGIIPRITGNLASTARVEVDENSVKFIIGGIQGKGSPALNVNYACIYNAHSIVKTKDGSKSIGQIKIGDLVLTQTGEYHTVIAKNSFKVNKKPDLIEIETEYRKGRNHKVIVTQDHKILTYREGRNKWVEAGELKYTDLLYSLIKPSYNKGLGKKILKNCKFCNQEYIIGKGFQQGKIFCSSYCQTKNNQGINNPNYNKKWVIERRKEMSIRMKKFHKEYPEKHPNNILNKKGYRTTAELKIKEWLDLREIKYLEQYKIGRLFVDFYLPDTNEVIEADGAYWHKEQNKDIIRDIEILKEKPTIKITHFHFQDKRFTKILNINPLPNVFYVVCNPDTDSYINEKSFKKVRILKLNKITKNYGKLYDLTIDKVHSFYCNGIIVSNSYVNYGTSRQSPQFFMERSINSAFADLDSIAIKSLKSWLEHMK